MRALLPWRFLLALVLAAPLRAGSPALLRYEATAQLMGCTFGIAAYGPDRESLAVTVENAFAEARRIESWLSDYRPHSELSKLNQTAANAPFAVSPELFDLLTTANEFSEASEGAFDMTVGPAVRAWGFHGGNPHVPDSRELKQARRTAGYRFVQLDAGRKTVHFLKPGMQLDPGAIGKGYAVDRMIAVLQEAGISAALVNACQSSLYGLGAPPDDSRGWAIEIENPIEDTLETVFLKDRALATSGSQEKFFENEGRTYSHILDPRTSEPAQGMMAVSVISATAIDADVWSTALFVNGLDWAVKKSPLALKVYACPSAEACRWIH